MTMPYSPSRAVYEGNGAATRFPFSFKVWDASQLVVTLTSPAGLTTEASGWTADIGASGGEIVYLHDAAPLPPGWRLAVTRNMPFTQEVNLVSASRFDPQVIEDALDQAAAERQQTLEMMRRAVILPATSDESPQDVVQDVYTARDNATSACAAAQAAMHESQHSATEAATQASMAQTEATRAKSEADRAQNLAAVGPATAEKPGLVKIGEGIAVQEDGTVSVTPVNLATKDTAGVVIIGEGLDISLNLLPENENGEGASSPPPGTLSLAAHASETGEKYGKGDSQFFGHVKITDDFEQNADATSGISISPKGVKTAFNRVVGILSEQIITSSRTWVVPETGRYSITAVGGGGNGGSGGNGDWTKWIQYDLYNYAVSSGGGGGGGGSGERTTLTTTLTKGASYNLTIGGAGGATTFGALLTARGGGHGNSGGSGYLTSDGNGGSVAHAGGGGGAGVSYGGGAGNGSGGGAYQSQNPEPRYGGGGGYGGTSADGYYGNGGAGGNGGGVTSESYGYLYKYGPNGGVAGRQGCIKIKIVPA